MPRVFLDANVLFSAAWREDPGLKRLWDLKGTVLLTSAYAVVEARVNLNNEERVTRLGRLVEKMEVLDNQPEASLPPGIVLPDKDVPILQAAVHSSCRYLLTGDQRDFDRWFGKKVMGVKIMRPGDYLRRSGK